MLHLGRARHPGPGPRSFIPGQLSVEFVNVGGWLIDGGMASDSCAQFLVVAEHSLILPGPGPSVIIFGKRVVSLSGRLLAGIRSLAVMLGLGSSACTVPPQVLTLWLPNEFRELVL